ncbi:MAG: tyrosine-type recombinase/integrase [Rouxiella badensis]|uniref:phage integrase n=1 Tax=Rouxiella badensis TaxID=1646377 RepID=UPI003C36F55B
MGIRKLSSGEWQVDFYPEGRQSKLRHRKKFATKGEALAFERNAMDIAKAKPWLGSAADDRTLKDLVNTWYERHGSTLKDGDRRKDAMYHAYECMGQPLAIEFDAEMFSKYREKRLNGEFARSQRVTEVKPRTINLEHAYFKAVFNELTRLGIWSLENPLNKIRKFRTEESEMAFLSDDELISLLEECKKVGGKNLYDLVTVCLSTGARWGEAATLTRSKLTPHRITYTKTKGKKNRTVPISKELYDSLATKKGKMFTECYSFFRTALRNCGIELPPGQLTHVLRHTFASHFMMEGGNILVLQRILGHADIQTTMRYAHFSPDHLDDAIRFNPLVKIASKLPHQDTNID